jgi:hypothetical protein
MPPCSTTRAATPFNVMGRIVAQPPRRVACVLLVAVVASCVAASASGAETAWRITKENGAFRVNGCKLTANGKLSDPNTATERTLTRKELNEIGRAIDAYEASPHADDRYAAPAVAGVRDSPSTDSSDVKSTPPLQSPPSETPQWTSHPAEAPPSNSQSSDDSQKKTEPNYIAWFLGLIVVVIILALFLNDAKKTCCPKCGNVEIKTLSHEAGGGGLRVKTEYDYNTNRGRQRLVNVTHHRFRCYCPKCRHQWDHDVSEESDN